MDGLTMRLIDGGPGYDTSLPVMRMQESELDRGWRRCEHFAAAIRL